MQMLPTCTVVESEGDAYDVTVLLDVLQRIITRLASRQTEGGDAVKEEDPTITIDVSEPTDQ
jgi:hypothetical protein